MNKMPRTFCLSLRETPIRTRIFQESAKMIGLDAEIFYGLFGQRLHLKPVLSNELECPGRNNYMSENGVACNLSHLLLWNVMKYLPEDEFLVLEDDAVFDEKFMEKFSALYDQLPADWQFVYVGWIPYGKDITPVTVTDGISIRTPAGTHAYLVKKSALEILCDAIQPVQSNIDLTIIHQCLPKLKYYVFDPPLVIQRTYCNIKDTVWTSLIYDWKSDLQGYKRRMFRELNLKEGWFDLEKDKSSHWCWSQENFTIQLPTCIEKLSLYLSSPISNQLSIILNGNRTEHKLVTGDNELHIETQNAPMLTGNVQMPFIPCKHNPKSSDSRLLGISLRRMVLDIGPTQIEVDISEL